MKKEQVNAILLEQKRKRKITSYSFLIIVIMICSLSLLFLYFNKFLYNRYISNIFKKYTFINF